MDRWRAYDSGNWMLYNHLKQKVKGEIIKSKQVWANKMMENTTGLWKLVKCHKETTKSDVSALIKSCGTADNLVKHLQEELQKHFAKQHSSDALYLEDEDDWNFNVTEYEVWSKLRKYPK